METHMIPGVPSSWMLCLLMLMTVQLLTGTYHTLKDAISSHAADDHKKFCCDELSGALKQWDSKMKAIRKAMPSNTPKASSAKAKAKGKAGK